MNIEKQGFGERLAGAVLFAALAGAAGLCQAGNNPKLGVPEGFGAATTGGKGAAEVVTVSTPNQLRHELCRSYGSDGLCTDDTPRIVNVQGTIDFTGSEGQASGLGCDYGQACSAPNKTEKLVLIDSNDAHCNGLKTYPITYDKAANPMLVGSNKTVIGVGADARIKGKGLRLVNVSNVIVRNLTISDINEGIIFAGDGLVLDNVDRVWIDHNRFERIGRQFIAGGFGPVTNTTISWNDFNGNSAYSFYCNGTHYWNVLLGGRTQTITMSNNWFRKFSGRAPHISEDSLLHLANNYFQDGFWHALDAVNPTKVLAEGNYFANVNAPIVNNGQGYIFGSLGGPNAAAQSQCKAYLGRNCTGNLAKPEPQNSAFAQESIVVQKFGAARASSQILLPYKASDVPTVVPAGAGPGKI